MSKYDRDWFFAELESIDKHEHVSFMKQLDTGDINQVPVPPVSIHVQVGDKYKVELDGDDLSDLASSVNDLLPQPSNDLGIPNPIYTEEDGADKDNGATGAGVVKDEGGAGSGHYGHQGIPGSRGGSAQSGGPSTIHSHSVGEHVTSRDGRTGIINSLSYPQGYGINWDDEDYPKPDVFGGSPIDYDLVTEDDLLPKGQTKSFKKYASPGTGMVDVDSGTMGGGGKKGEDLNPQQKRTVNAFGDEIEEHPSNTAEQVGRIVDDHARAGVFDDKYGKQDVGQLPLTKPTTAVQPSSSTQSTQPSQPQQPSDTQMMKPVVQGIDQEILSTPVSDTGLQEGPAGLSNPAIAQPQPKNVLLHNGQNVQMGEHIDALHQRLTDAGYKLGNRDVKQDGSSTIDYNNDEVGHKVTVHHDGNGKIDGFKESLSATKALDLANSALKGIGDILGGIGGVGGAFCSICKCATSAYRKCPRCNKVVCGKCYNHHSRSHPPIVSKGFPYNLKFE